MGERDEKTTKAEDKTKSRVEAEQDKRIRGEEGEVDMVGLYLSPWWQLVCEKQYLVLERGVD